MTTPTGQDNAQSGHFERCPQAWHVGLSVGLLTECRFPAGHRGWHRDEDGDVSWGGKLDADEMAVADALRGAR